MVAAEPGVSIWTKPNAGMPLARSWPREYDVGPEEMGESTVCFILPGTQLVGGCCGSTPAHGHAIAETMRQDQQEAIWPSSDH